MKRTVATICLTLAVLLGSVGTSWGADFNKGLAAFQSADFATAVREWKSIAEQGNARAQFNLGVAYIKGVPAARRNKVNIAYKTPSMNKVKYIRATRPRSL